MTQYVINIGAIPNDGTGDPLRTAFNETNLNFNQVFAAGPVLSNIQIANNTILTTTTNGNLILAPNGIGRIQANATIVPSVANVRDLGSATQRWNTVYTQYLDLSGVLTTGDLTVDGNLTVQGNTIQIGNIVTDTKTIQLANTASNASSANGSGITVGLNDNIATMLYSSASNVWTTNIGISATGNISGNFVAPGANGQVLYNRSGVIGASPSNFNFDQSTQTLYVTVGAFAGQANGTNSLFVGAPGFTELGSNIMGQFTGNVASYSQINLQNTSNASAASGDYVITADNGTDSTYYLDMGLLSSNHADSDFFGDTGTANDGYLYVTANDQAGPGNSNIGNLILGSTNGVIKLFVGNTAQANVIQTVSTNGVTVAGNILPSANVTYSLGNSSLWWSNIWVANNTIYIGGVPLGMTAGNVLTVAGEPVLVNDSNTTITTTGNITADYFIGDGSLLTGISGGANIGNLEIAGTVIEIAAGAPETVINITPSGPTGGWAYLQLPTNDTANISDTRLHNDAGNIEFGTGDFSTGSTDYIWTLDNTGNLNLPANGDLNFNGGSIAQTLNEDIYIRASDDENDGWSVYNVVDDGAGNTLSHTRLEFDQYTVRTDAQGAAYTWAFRDTGVLELPGDIYGNVGGNLTVKIGDSAGSDTFIDLQTRSYVGDALISNIRIANPNVTVSTASGVYNWNFDNTGNLNLPPSGNLVGVTANNNGYINWLGNSSGDLNGYTTLRLVPDDTRESSDQYLIVDPTAPGHIHIRAGGTQDNSGADLFLGGENSYFRVASGANSAASVSANSYVWTYGTDGTFSLPASESPGQYSEITSVGNSSGDGNGYATLQLKPDASISGDSYLIIDPTAPNHIHIRAGGAQDNSGAQLFLGGENSYFLVENGANSNVYVASNSNQWKFDTTGVLTLPGEGVLQSLNDTVTLSSLNTTTGNANSVYLGSSGGLGFNDQEAGGNWLEIFRSGSDPEIRVPPGGGNILITGASGSGGAGGRNITITAGPADQTNYYTTAGGTVNIVGGLGATDDGGGGGPGGNVNITAGVSADPAGHAGNVNITAGSNSWVFDYSGNVTIPGNINAVLSSPAPSLNGFDSVNAVNVNASGNVSATANITGGNLTVGSGTITGGNVNGATFNGNVAFGNGTVGGSGNITGGNISAIGNIIGSTAGFAIGYRDIPQVAFTGNATIATTDAGKHFYSTQSSNYTLTIANNASQGFQVGAAITIVNQGTGNITVAQGSGVTLYLAGNATSGNRTVSTFGMATIMKVATDTWFINGTGVS